MSFLAYFSVSQGINPADITISDISMGSDVNITSRQIRLIQVDSTLLLPANSLTQYINWPLGNNTITLSAILDKDYALAIQVDWIVSPATPGNTYTKTRLYIFDGFLKTFSYSLTQQQVANPNVVNDRNYFSNREKLDSLISAAEQALVSASDQFSAQYCLDMATDMKTNANSYF